MTRSVGAAFVVASVGLFVMAACATSGDQRNVFAPAQADQPFLMNNDGAYPAGVSAADFAARRTDIWREQVITVPPEQIFEPG